MRPCMQRIKEFISTAYLVRFSKEVFSRTEAVHPGRYSTELLIAVSSCTSVQLV